MCRIELRGEANLSILNLHALTEEKPEEIKKNFMKNRKMSIINRINVVSK